MFFGMYMYTHTVPRGKNYCLSKSQSYVDISSQNFFAFLIKIFILTSEKGPFCVKTDMSTVS